MRNLALVAITIGLLVTACGDSGPEAPRPGAPESVCAANFCVTYPADWEVVEEGPDFVSWRHPLGEDILATVGQVNMEGIVTAAGDTWPRLPEDVARAFWRIIDGGGAELVTIETIADGSVVTSGTVSTGRLWWRLTPTGISDAVGLEVRAPNRSWEPHADVFLQGLVVTE